MPHRIMNNDVPQVLFMASIPVGMSLANVASIATTAAALVSIAFTIYKFLKDK